MTSSVHFDLPKPRPESSVRLTGGPPLLLPAIAFALLTIAAVAVSIKTPTPTASAETVLNYQLNHGTLVRLGGFLQFAAALPLAIWAATVHGRLRVLGVKAFGPTMAFVGGARLLFPGPGRPDRLDQRRKPPTWATRQSPACSPIWPSPPGQSATPSRSLCSSQA